MSEVKVSNVVFLHPKVQKWMYDEGWDHLSEIQEQAVPFVLNRRTDGLLASATASGKTEAVFFPLLSQMLAEKEPLELVLCVSPLKALIDDQWLRLTSLADGLGIDAVAWHGDAPQGPKKKFAQQPKGLLVITPESLEALVMRQSQLLPELGKNLGAVVIDEAHAFLGTARGRQVQSLLHRLESYCATPPRRIGLSATLGDMAEARRWLRPHAEDAVEVLQVQQQGSTMQALVDAVALADDDPAEMALVAEIGKCTQQGHHLIFPNSRAKVETFAQRLTQWAQARGLATQYFAHHGNLSKEPRSVAEEALRNATNSVSVVCTSTLELGISIGNVKTVVQVGAPPSVASLRQRLGRTGRRKGAKSALRGLVAEPTAPNLDNVADPLRTELVRLVACVQLVREQWYEPVRAGGCQYSTLIQQVFSRIYERAGASASQLLELLVQTGPFQAVNAAGFHQLLDHLVAQEMLQREPGSDLLLLTPRAEKLVEHYTFYAAFPMVDEYRVLAGERLLGTLPMTGLLTEGQPLIFAGQRWRVTLVNADKKLVLVSAAPAGKAPVFTAANINVHQVVREKMLQLYRTPEAFDWITEAAHGFMRDASQHFHRYGLDNSCLLQKGTDVYIFPWLGDTGKNALHLILKAAGLFTQIGELTLMASKTSVAEVQRKLEAAALAPMEDNDLLPYVVSTDQQKWDRLVPDSLLKQQQFSEIFDIDAAKTWLIKFATLANR